MKQAAINLDAFSSGQIKSKLWLCDTIEGILHTDQPSPQVIWVLGGWYGVLSFLLLSRGKLPIKTIRSFDMDHEVCLISEKLNELWQRQPFIFKSISLAVNQISFTAHERYESSKPTIVINTSIEHMSSRAWFKSIPPGTWVALQTCDMKHPEHINLCYSQQQLRADYPLTKEEFCGELYFDYKGASSFTRYMLIGKK